MLEPMKTASHVLIVSRSQIPFNVMCVRKGGYPKYVRPRKAEYKEGMSNNEIFEWIKNKFKEGNTKLFNSNKLEHSYYQGLSEQEKAEIFYEIIKKNVDQAQEEAIKEAQVFVSYLRACLKNHSCHLHNDAIASYSPLCVIFAPNSGYIARYAPFI